MNLPDELHYYDLYAPLVSSVELRYTPEEAQSHVVRLRRSLLPQIEKEIGDPPY